MRSALRRGPHHEALSAMRVNMKSVAAGSPRQDPLPSHVTLSVSGMTCAGCQSFVQKTLLAQPGVRDASVNLMMQNATVDYLPQTISPDRLVKAVERIDYGAQLPALNSSAIDDQSQLDDQQLRV